MNSFTRCDSPLGSLLLTSDGEALTGIAFPGGAPVPEEEEGWQRDDAAPLFAEARRQLAEYFAGQRTDFELPLAPSGTPFQLQVWAELRRIPYGTTISYGEQARRIGKPKAARAVGLANGRNPISIVVPCHRVVGADGTLTGFGGGLPTKRALLDLESRAAASAGVGGQGVLDLEGEA